MFTKIEGDNAILFKGGVYRVCDLYKDRSNRLFAKIGSGFVALRASGDTSMVGMAISEVSTEQSLFVSKMGNLYVAPAEDRHAMGFPEARKLLGIVK